jgi:hypothetical protein
VRELELEPLHEAVRALAPQLRGALETEAEVDIGPVLDAAARVGPAQGDRAAAAREFRSGLEAVRRLAGLTSPARLRKAVAERSTRTVLLAHLVRQAIDQRLSSTKPAASSFDELGLGPVFASLFAELEPDQDPWRLVSVIRLIGHLPPVSSVAQAPPADRAAAIARALTADDAVCQFIGVNVWQDVAWFNRESWQQLLAWLAILDALAAMAAEGAGRPAAAKPAARLKDTDALIGALSKAGEASGYQLDKLEAVVSPEQAGHPTSRRS